MVLMSAVNDWRTAGCGKKVRGLESTAVVTPAKSFANKGILLDFPNCHR
jgi:hypothetical protein